MGKLQDYLTKKKLDLIGYPRIYVVKSTRESVELPVERTVIAIQYKKIKSNYSNKSVFLDEYILDQKFPYKIEIEEDKINASEDGYSTGFGDLWQWSYYCTLSKKDADEYYLKEIERVSQKYKIIL